MRRCPDRAGGNCQRRREGWKYNQNTGTTKAPEESRPRSSAGVISMIVVERVLRHKAMISMAARSSSEVSGS